MRWWESFRPAIEQTMIANALISSLKEKLPLTYLQFTSNNKLATIAKKSKDLYLLSMHKSYYFHANKPVNIITYTWKTKRFVRNQGHIASIQRSGHWAHNCKMTYCTLFSFHLSSQGRSVRFWRWTHGRKVRAAKAFQKRGGLGVCCSWKLLNFGSRKCRFLCFCFSVDK